MNLVDTKQTIKRE